MSQFFSPNHLLGATLALMVLDSLFLGFVRRKIAELLFAVFVGVGAFVNLTGDFTVVYRDHPTLMLAVGIVITGFSVLLLLAVNQAPDETSSPNGWYFGKVYIGMTGILGSLSGIMMCLSVTGVL